MVLIIRTQDFASRNLDRVSQSLGRLSKQEAFSRRRAQLRAAEAAQKFTRGQITDELAAIRMMQQRLDLEQKVGRFATDPKLRARGAGGRFVSVAADVKQLQLLRQNIDTLPPRLARLSESGTLLADRAKVLEHRLDQVNRRLRITQSDISLLGRAQAALRWDNLHRFGQAISRLSRIGQLTGLIMVGSFVAMGNAAANFGKEATLAATQARDIGAPIEQVAIRSERLQNAILAQMQRFPAGAEEMSRAAYEIFSSLDLSNKGVFNFSRGIKILEALNKAAVGGLVDLDEATRGLVITFNNFAKSGADGIISMKSVNSILDMMFNIVRYGEVRFGELAVAMERIAPAAGDIGQSLKDIAAPIAFLTTRLGVERAAAGFARLSEIFGNREFIAGFEAMTGFKITRPEGGLIPFVKILDRINAAFPELAQGRRTLVGFLRDVTSAGAAITEGRKTLGREFTIQGRRALQPLLRNLERVHELQGLISGNAGEFQAAFTAMMRQPSIQWAIFINQMKAVALTIGRAALPALLDLAAWVQKAIKWFRELSPHTRDLVVKVMVMGSAFLLAGSLLGGLLGGLASLIGTLGILNPQLLKLVFSAKALAGIGAIALVLRTAWTGEASALDFIFAAIGGGYLGAMFGPAGAVIGGITLPILMFAIWKGRNKSPSEQAFDEFQKIHREGLPIWKQVAAGFALPSFTGINLFDPKMMDQKEFQRQWNLLALVRKKGLKSLSEDSKRAFGEIDPLVKRLYKEYAPKGAKGFDDIRKQIRRAIGAAKDETINEKLQAQLKTLEEIRNQYLDVGEASQKAKRLQQAHANAVQQATENMKNKVKTAVDNMVQLWDRLRQTNEQALGSLFQGPTMTGIIGNVFSEINGLLRQFGVQIPVPFEILRQDLDQQIAYFKRWREDINKLLKRGAPLEFIKALEEMGPEAGIPIAEGLLQGGEKGFKDLIDTWKKGQKLIRSATQRDLDATLEDWKKHGKDAAWAMLNGLISTSQDYKLRKNFETYVKNTFGSILQKEFKEEVALAMENAMADLAASSTKSGGGGNKGGTTGGRGGKRGGRRPVFLGTMEKPIPVDPRIFTGLGIDGPPHSFPGQGRSDTNHYYAGDNITIRADGATPDSVSRALQKHSFTKRNRFRGRK